MCIAVNRVRRVRIRESGQLGIGNRLDEGREGRRSLTHVVDEGVIAAAEKLSVRDIDGAAACILDKKYC